MPVLGHVAPMAALTGALAQRGYDLIWYSSRFFQERIEASGARFVPISSTPDYGESDCDRHFPERRKFLEPASSEVRLQTRFRRCYVGLCPRSGSPPGRLPPGRIAWSTRPSPPER